MTLSRVNAISPPTVILVRSKMTKAWLTVVFPINKQFTAIEQNNSTFTNN